MKDVVYRVGYALDTVCCPIKLAYALNPQPRPPRINRNCSNWFWQVY